MQEYIIPIISAAVSVSSIFVSNWLGMKNQITNRKIETDKEIYYSLYVPLIKWLTSKTFSFKSYYWLIAFPRYANGEADFLSQLLIENFEKLPVSVAERYGSYAQYSATASSFYCGETYNYDFKGDASEASKNFDFIIQRLLQEGSAKARMLGLPDISKSILTSFLEDKENYIGPRYLSLITHKQPLKPAKIKPTS